MQDSPGQDPAAIIKFSRKMQKLLPVLGPRFEAIITRVQNPSPPQKP
jgi:hypothetical protein